MLLSHEDSQLVLIDFQSRLLPALHGGADALANALRLAKLAKAFKVPVFATEQVPDKLGTSPQELTELTDQTVVKADFSATEVLSPLLQPIVKAPQGNARSLPKHLQKNVTAPAPRTSIVLAGCEAHVCLLQTALELLDQEMDVWVVTDACASRTERNRDAAYDRLAGNGAELVTTEMVAFEWLRTAEHSNLKLVQSLIR